jgi:hypothetical protein
MPLRYRRARSAAWACLSVELGDVAGMAEPKKWHPALRWVAKGAIAALILNEVRGLILAGPVLYTIWLAGGIGTSVMAALFTLACIALSVLIPWWVVRRFVKRAKRKPPPKRGLSGH